MTLRWYNASRRHPCPVCGSKDWCSVRADGAVVACRRNPLGRLRTDSSGVDYYLHWLLESERPKPVVMAPVETGPQRAPAAHRDAVYRRLLAALALSNEHRAQLSKRGIPTERHNDYATLPERGPKRWDAVNAVLGAGLDPNGVPGLRIERVRWTLAGAAGLLVPCMNVEGLIVALKVRVDGATSGKYRYLTSAPEGPRAEPAVHVPVGTPWGQPVLRVTEGELKSSAAFSLSGVPTISVPGVGSWRAALPVIEELAPEAVQVAFDADAATNPAVDRAGRELVAAVRETGRPCVRLRWDIAEGRGIDDVLLARRTKAEAA